MCLKANVVMVMLSYMIVPALQWCQSLSEFLSVGQQAYVMARCPSCVRPCVNFFFKHLLL